MCIRDRVPGTLSIGAAVMERVIIELVRSADWSAGVVLVNGHGGNRVPVEQAVRVLHAEQRRVLAWWPNICLLYTSPSPRDRTRSRMPSSA